MFSKCIPQISYDLEVPPHLIKLLLSLPAGVVDGLCNDLPQRLPAILTSPLLQESNGLRLVSRQLEVERLRVIRNKLPLRSKLPQNGQEIVPVSFVAPRLEARILDVGIQEGSDVDEGDVLDIDKECLVVKC